MVVLRYLSLDLDLTGLERAGSLVFVVFAVGVLVLIELDLTVAEIFEVGLLVYLDQKIFSH